MASCDPAPVLVLALGNVLLADDALGLELLELLRDELEGDPRVELLDGGTQGLALLGRLEGRASVLILDAVQQGFEPGTVHLVRDPLSVRAPRGLGAHGGNASELLSVASLLGVLPPRVHVVGVEPDVLDTRLGLSEAAERSLPWAGRLARELVGELLDALERQEESACTS